MVFSSGWAAEQKGFMAGYGYGVGGVRWGWMDGGAGMTAAATRVLMGGGCGAYFSGVAACGDGGAFPWVRSWHSAAVSPGHMESRRSKYLGGPLGGGMSTGVWIPPGGQ